MYLLEDNTQLVAPTKKSMDSFCKAASAQGFEARLSTQKEKVEDIDLVLWDPENKSNAFAVSIKKTLLKKSKKRKHLWGWIELRNRRGESGWLYTKCTFIVYERKNDFVLLFKKDLKAWIEANNLGRWDLPFVKTGWQAAYRLFRRADTKEAIFHLKVSDALKQCKHHIWPKS